MSPELVRLAALSAAFWTSLVLARRSRAVRENGQRLVLGLVLGALAAHLGWALLQLPAVVGAPALLLDATRGQSLLFVPLGLLAAEPAGHDRARFRDAVLGAQPAAWALAKLGCAAAGCCGGALLALAEASGFLAVYALAARARSPAALALCGLGAVRLLAEPLRPALAMGEPLLAPGALALAWLLAGAGLSVSGRGGPRSRGAPSRARAR